MATQLTLFDPIVVKLTQGYEAIVDPIDSDYKGVQWCTRLGKWQAKIKLNRKSKNLGFFDDPQLAYEAYCKAATELFGEFARLK